MLASQRESCRYIDLAFLLFCEKIREAYLYDASGYGTNANKRLYLSNVCSLSASDWLACGSGSGCGCEQDYGSGDGGDADGFGDGEKVE